ncbi:gluconate:H+ symporter [Aureisphaera galaxeae]|uniref:GntP family permease n=1 Tax=Aureisphaera galaxeae TaxID=1538023 RepID=UPI00234FE1F3|nr:gluconate:H+ symporter [Aureisphaera galaxeae]MDC8004229.1 gluconate:H+ symporter [Aureisphaera galaxeae]
MDSTLLIAIFVGIAALLLLILRFRIQAFIALLIASIIVGIIAGMDPYQIIVTIQEGMGSTLGFVAVVVGLGAMFGAILEHSGGAEAVASFLLSRFKEKGTSWALMLTGFLIAIPVFFDVAFIILVPMIYSLQRTSKKSLLLYGIPLLAGLAVTHTFIPPTPGPVAVADILKADLGWVIVFGFIVGIPTAIISGPIFGRYIAKKIHIDAPALLSDIEQEDGKRPSVWMIFSIIALPIFLIVGNTFLNSDMASWASESVKNWAKMIGHPFVALILANLIAWYVLGIKRGNTAKTLQTITGKSLAPAGIIILLTGAGGVFKQMLIETGTGTMMADYFKELGLGILVVSFIIAALVRILQGSATVAMITAAGVVASLLETDPLGAIDTALLVIAIASGATILSHVNDSGFWMVCKYMGMTEKQTFRSFTVMTTVLALVGITFVGLISIFV